LEGDTLMVGAKCENCKKTTFFQERMIYCTFCGTKFEDLEIYNASQKSNQTVLIGKTRLWFLWGGMILLLFLISPLLSQLVTEKVISQAQGSAFYLVAFIFWVFISIKMPFIRGLAKKRYPEKSSVE
jgi:hypothetical protein